MKEQIAQIREALKVELGELAWADRYPTDNEKQRAGSLRTALAALAELEAQPPAKVDVDAIMEIYRDSGEKLSQAWMTMDRDFHRATYFRVKLTELLTNE